MIDMDYKQKYKEALTWVESIYHELSHDRQMEAEAFFPELKESEDEKIRKEILSFCQGRADNYPNAPMYGNNRKWIAWLEKQGKNPQGKSALEAINEEKVESKFHEGDWLCENELNNYARFIQILETVNVQGKERYRISRDIHNDEDIVEFDFIEKYYHKFDIKDAKDGDVLACPPQKGYEAGEQVFIFKSINSRDYVDNCIEYYCRICEGVFYENKNGYMGTTSTPLYPATKEQRDTLFAKMEKSGYKWDAEKKELKLLITNGGDFCESENCEKKPDDKIEPIDEFEGLTDFERTLADICIGWIGKEIGWKQYIKDNADVLLKIAVEKFNSVQDVPFDQEAFQKEADAISEKVINAIPEGANFGHIYTALCSIIATLLTDGETNPIKVLADTMKINNMLLMMVKEQLKAMGGHSNAN